MSIRPTIRNLSYLQKINTPQLAGYKLAEAFEDLGDSVGNVANQVASSPDGSDITPPKIGQVQAQHVGGGALDIAITDNSKVQRAVEYFVEYAPNPGFSGSRYLHLVSSRNGTVMVPNGRWYVKAYSQYRFGGPPSEAITSGPISVTGSVVTQALLATQGCGTGQPGQTGTGAGTEISR
jgi:hypothetical protein